MNLENKIKFQKRLLLIRFWGQSIAITIRSLKLDIISKQC